MIPHLIPKFLALKMETKMNGIKTLEVQFTSFYLRLTDDSFSAN